MSIQALRGTHDILPPSTDIWRALETYSADLFSSFGYKELRTPIFESTELFQRTIGENTDIVSKEMYTFNDRKNRSITLRPEGTASIARSVIQHKLIQPGQSLKLYYTGPMFRYERPQAGRQRQFHQTGLECLGSSHYMADVEVIQILYRWFSGLGLGDIKIVLNTTGSLSSRPKITETMRQWLTPVKASLCEDCQTRFHKNVLRIYDCKVKSCREIVDTLPGFLELIEGEDLEHFKNVKQGLTALGLPFEVSPKCVRGLDYYTRTIFEIHSTLDQDGQSVLAGGGRYDQLYQDMQNPFAIPAVGFAIGMERVISLLDTQKHHLVISEKPLLAILCPEESDYAANLNLAQTLRSARIRVEMDILGRNLKSQMKWASKIKADFALIQGSTERDQKKCIVKNLNSFETQELNVDQLSQWANQIFK